MEFRRWYSGDWLQNCPATFQFISIEIPDDAQINVELYTFLNFFN